MRTLTHLGLALLLCSVVAAPAASFTTFANPDAAYLASTTLIPVVGADFTNINSISDGTLTVGFSTPMNIRTVPDNWATWSSPPFSETATPRVLFTSAETSLTMTLSSPMQIFGFEAEPNPFLELPFTAQFYNGATLIGTINRDVSGSGGARLFAAAYSPDGFTSVVVSSQREFAIAQLRYSDSPPVPEPASMVLVTGSLIGLLAKRRMRK